MSARFIIEGSSAGAVKALADLNKALDAAEKSTDSTAKASKRLSDQAQRIRESVDPIAKYNRQINDLVQFTTKAGLSTEHARLKALEYGAALDKAGESGRRSFGGIASEAKGMLLSLATVGTAVQQLRADWDAIVQRAERATQSTRTVAQAEAAFRETTAGDPRREEMRRAAFKIAQLNNLPAESVITAMEQAYGAGGSADLAMATVAEAARQTKDPARLTELAAGYGDVVQGTTIADSQEASGYLAIAQATSRLKGEKVAGQLAKVAATFNAAGGSEAAAAAALSALSVFGADPEGERSRTAAIQLSQKSEEFFKKKGGKYGLQEAAYDTPDERIALLQSNESMAKAFMQATTFEAASVGAVSKMLMTDEGRKLYGSAFYANDERAERLAAAAQRAEYILQGPVQASAQTGAAVSSGTQAYQLSQAELGTLTQEERQKVIDAIAEAMGGLFSGTRANIAAAAVGGPTLERSEAINLLGAYRDQAEGPLRESMNAMIGELMKIEANTKKQRVTTRQE